MKIYHDRRGFTLVELMVTIVLIGMVVTLAGSLFNFSFMAEKNTEKEYDLQSEVRLASQILNKSIRDSTVTFTIPDTLFQKSKKAKWNYFGIENHNEIVQYSWDGTTHVRKVLVKASDGVKYNLYFVNNAKDSKLIEFNLECFIDGNESKKIAIKTELDALNSVALDDGGSAETPATAIAYRTDPRPTPENVTISVSMALDKSGSMDENMTGGKRISIMKSKAKGLLAKFSDMGNVQVCIVPYSTSANNADNSMTGVTGNLSSLQQKIENMSANGGTNIGDALRRSYYAIKNYNNVNAGKQILNYVILLTDGEPTYCTKEKVSGVWKYYVKDGADISENKTTDGGNIAGPGNDYSQDCMDYIGTIGSDKIINGGFKIKTFVIGFSDNKDDVAHAKSIAEDKCKGTYYYAGDAAALEKAFDDIKTVILNDSWHIYGPYSD